MNYSFEEMLKYDMFKSVDEVKEFLDKNDLLLIGEAEYNQLKEIKEAIVEIQEITDNISL